MAAEVIDFASEQADASSTTVATKFAEPLDVQVGDILVACIQHSTAGDTTVTFSGGNVTTWNAVGSGGLAHGTGLYVDLAWGVVTSAGTGLYVTATLGASRPYRGLCVVQIRGAAASLVDWEYIERASAEGLTFSTPALTFSRAGIIVGFTSPYEGRSFTPTSPATEVYDPASYYTGAMVRSVTGAGSVDIGTTVSGSFNGFVVALGFEEVLSSLVSAIDEPVSDRADYIKANAPGLVYVGDMDIEISQPPSGGAGQLAQAQSPVNGRVSNGNTIALNFASPPAQDSLVIIVAGGWAAGGWTSTANDIRNGGASAGFTLAGQIAAPIGNNVLSVWWKKAGASEPSTYTFDPQNLGATYASACALNWTGQDLTSPIDRFYTVSGTSSTPSITDSTPTSTANQLVIAAMAGDESTTDLGIDVPATTDYTNAHVEQNASDYNGLSVDYKIATSTGVQSAAWGTLAMSAKFSALLLTIKPANSSPSIFIDYDMGMFGGAAVKVEIIDPRVY